MNKNQETNRKIDEAVRRFKQINEYDAGVGTGHVLNEYTFNSGAMNEEGEDDDNQPQQGGISQQGGNQMNGAPQGGMPQDNGSMNAGMPAGQQNGMQGGNDMPQGGGMPQDDPMMGNNISNTGNNTSDNMNLPNDSDSLSDDISDTPEDSEDDDNDTNNEDEDNDDEKEDKEDEDEEVIDVDELVDGQDTTQYKVDNLDSKINDLLKIIGKVAKAVDVNSKKTEEFKDKVTAELKHRMPNDQEKINIRTLASKPYNLSPNEYWEKEAKTNPNYKIIANNDIAPQDEEEYILRKSDLDHINDNEIDRTIDELPKELLDYFN